MRRQRKRAPKWKEERREGEGREALSSEQPALDASPEACTRRHPASGTNSDVLPATPHHGLQAQGRRSKPLLGCVQAGAHSPAARTEREAGCVLSASLARGEDLASPSTGEKRVLGHQHQRGFRPWTGLFFFFFYRSFKS